jgi:hypothetical protein
MTESGRDRRRALEDWLARPMFALAALFLVLVAAAIYLARSSREAIWNQPAAQIVVAGLLLLWPLFMVEGLLRFYLTPRNHRNRKALALSLVVALLPPARMAAHSPTRPDHIWLPWLGWQQVDFDLNKTLERFFRGPMFFMALMILPVLAVEYFWSDAVEAYPLLRTVLGISTSVIWLAFATEFVIRFSAAEKKMAYALNQWVDLAVVLLPLVEFLPFLRVLRATRIMRLQNLTRMAKYYRLYGLAGKGWRGLVVLQLIWSLFSRSREARLSLLKGNLEENREQIQELEREADYYRRRIEALEKEFAEQADGARDTAHRVKETIARRPADGGSSRGTS